MTDGKGYHANQVDNRMLVQRFADLFFRQKKVREAFEEMVAENYVQHNPMAADGRAAAIDILEGMFASMPEMTAEVRRILVDGDLAAVHSLIKMSPADRGMAVVDLFRIADGRIVEHWDVVQPVPEESANSNGMV